MGPNLCNGFRLVQVPTPTILTLISLSLVPNLAAETLALAAYQ